MRYGPRAKRRINRVVEPPSRNFELARDYYVNFHDLNARAPQSVLGMPLVITAGKAQVPGPQEILVSSGVTDYVGVQPGAEAIVEFVYSGAGEPVVERLDGLRLIGTFDITGPDQGRFEPFWRFNVLQLALVLASGVAIAVIASLLLATISTASLIVAAGLTALAAGLASLLVLGWPLRRLAAELLRDAA